MRNHRKLAYGILLALLALAFILGGIIFSVRSDKLKVVFLDVGQGDAILVSQGSAQLLVDGGKDGKVLLEKLGKHVPFWDREIEMMVATHPDQDHIGGLVDALKAYRVRTILKTNARSDSQTYGKLEEEIAVEGAQEVEARKGVSIRFPGGALAEVVFPSDPLPDAVDNASNDHSIVLKLVYGASTFLFTGDLPSGREKEIISKNIDIQSDVLKAGHHGSKYSTGEEFLEAVRPAEAVISVGKNNSYGHPHPDVLRRLSERKVGILRTDEMGDIAYECADPSVKCARVAN